MGGRRSGSLLPECPGNQCIQREPLLRCNAIPFKPNDQEGERQTKILDLRQGQEVLVREFQGLVRAKGHPASLWRREAEGKHRCYRAIHRKPEERVYGCDSGANP